MVIFYRAWALWAQNSLTLCIWEVVHICREWYLYSNSDQALSCPEGVFQACLYQDWQGGRLANPHPQLPLQTSSQQALMRFLGPLP